MATVSIEGMGKFTYTINTNNTSDSGTMTFTLTSFEDLSPSKYKRKKGFWAGVKVDGKNFVGHTSKFAAVAKYSSNQGASGMIQASELANDRPVLYFDNKHDYKEARKLYNSEQQRYLKDNLAVLAKKVSNLSKNSKTIKVIGNQRDVTIVFQIYGYKQTITQKVGKTTGSSSNTAQEGVEYASITSVNDGIPYLVKTDAYKEYGWIERVVDFNDIEDPATLKRVAQIYLDSLQFDEMSIEVTALDLHYIDNTIQKLSLLDSVRCISKPHGLDKVFPITKVTIPLDHPDQVKYTLGTNQAGGGGISASSSMDAKKFTKALQAFPTKAYTLDTAKGQMSQMLNQRTTGYVTIVDRSENGQTHSEAIIISSGQDWTTSQSLWKWDMNGLGFSDKKLSDMTQTERTAYNATMTALGSKAINKVTDEDRWYRLGITNDGKIVADVIKVGVLSDAQGWNYWDLTNGTFSLSYRTDLILNSGETAKVGDVYTLASTADENASEAIITSNNAIASSIQANNAASAANSTATSALNKATAASSTQTSSKNLISKSDKASSWGGCSRGVSPADTYGKRTAVNLTYGGTGTYDSPEKDIKYGIEIETKALPAKYTEGMYGMVMSSVPVAHDTTYTFSCYIKKASGGADNKVILSAGKQYVDNSGTKPVTRNGYANSSASNATLRNWVKFSLVFKTTTADKVIEKDSNNAYRATTVTSSKNYVIDLCIYVGGAYSNLLVAGVMLVKGNKSGTWSPSMEDTHDDLTTYIDAITDRDREFSKEQRQALDDSFDQSKVLERLITSPSGVEAKGIWLKNNQLYINATYIRGGTLDAGIVKAGILTDQKQQNVWNMATGHFTTKSFEVSKGNVTGTFATGTKQAGAIQMSNGEIRGYTSKKLVGWINPNGAVTHKKTGKLTKGLIIGGGMIRFEAGFFTVTTNSKHNNVATSYQALTKDIPIVMSIKDRGNGSISWDHAYLNVVNGLITGYSVSPRNLK